MTNQRNIEHTSARTRRRLETGISRRGGSYSVRVRVHGRAIERSARTLAEARVLRAELRADPPAATINSRLTLRRYADEWLETYQGRTARGIRPETVDGYRVALERHVLPELGDTRLAELTPQDIKRLAGRLARTHKPSSVRRTLSPLRALLADAAEEGVIRVSPFSNVRLPSDTARPSDERVKALTDAEAAQLIEACTAPDDQLLLRLMLATGLRTGEALAVRWGDIDPRRVNVRRAVSRAGTIGPPKSRAGTRAVPIPPSLSQDLLRSRELSAHATDDELVFRLARRRAS